jgi:ubiquinone/menaquinone biosynthesis C-methylase UbiE
MPYYKASNSMALIIYIFIESGFPWGSLPKNSLIVDVGGGIGSVALKIAKVHPHLRMVIQDRPMVIEKGEDVCHALIFETVHGVDPFFHSFGRLSYPMLSHLVGSDLKVRHSWLLRNIL